MAIVAAIPGICSLLFILGCLCCLFLRRRRYGANRWYCACEASTGVAPSYGLSWGLFPISSSWKRTAQDDFLSLPLASEVPVLGETPFADCQLQNLQSVQVSAACPSLQHEVPQTESESEFPFNIDLEPANPMGDDDNLNVEFSNIRAESGRTIGHQSYTSFDHQSANESVVPTSTNTESSHVGDFSQGRDHSSNLEIFSGSPLTPSIPTTTPPNKMPVISLGTDPTPSIPSFPSQALQTLSSVSLPATRTLRCPNCPRKFTSKARLESVSTHPRSFT